MPRNATPARRKAATVIGATEGRGGSPASEKAVAVGRLRGARSDAALSSLQTTIETMFKLPRGSVLLVAPGRRRMDEDATVRDLRERWEKAR